MSSPNLKFSLSLYVQNRPGALARIALLFTRRSYNIDSLVVSAAYDPEFSWISIEANGNPQQIPLLIKQLHKLIGRCADQRPQRAFGHRNLAARTGTAQGTLQRTDARRNSTNYRHLSLQRTRCDRRFDYHPGCRRPPGRRGTQAPAGNVSNFGERSHGQSVYRAWRRANGCLNLTLCYNCQVSESWVKALIL